jgi:hypothetical protein
MLAAVPAAAPLYHQTEEERQAPSDTVIPFSIVTIVVYFDKLPSLQQHLQTGTIVSGSVWMSALAEHHQSIVSGKKVED